MSVLEANLFSGDVKATPVIPPVVDAFAPDARAVVAEGAK